VFGAAVSELPFVLAMATALIGFGVLVPWLVHESRRPVARSVAAPRPPVLSHHPRLRSLMVAAPCLSVPFARRMEPTSESVVSQWQTTFAAARHRAAASSRGAEMPPRAWSEKRERQYEHIKEGLEERGEAEDVAEEIAARTVNKERARAGEARQSSRSWTDDISSGRRGGLRSHRGPGGRTKAQLYNEARRKGVQGRSKMSKAQLERAVGG
jgi:plasmid stabilization system protein ParE